MGGLVLPPLASSPGGAQSDKVLSSASMSTRVAPRDHVNSPANGTGQKSESEDARLKKRINDHGQQG